MSDSCAAEAVGAAEPNSIVPEEEDVMARALGQRGIVRYVQSFLTDHFLFAGAVSKFWLETWTNSTYKFSKGEGGNAQRWHGVSSGITAALAALSAKPRGLRSYSSHEFEGLPRQTTYSAATSSVPCVAWSLHSGLQWTEKLEVAAVRQNSSTAIPVLSWSLGSGYLRARDGSLSVCNTAASLGQLETLKWAREHNLAWSERTCGFAAKGGHLATLQWLHANGCPFSAFTATCAVMSRRVDLLEWMLRETESWRWNEWMCSSAEQQGDLEVVDWLHKNGCPCVHTRALEASGAAEADGSGEGGGS